MCLRKKYLVAIVLFIMVSGSIMAQNDDRPVDSIRITMTTPYDAGVKWNCSCVIHNNLVSVTISESCRKLEIPKNHIVMPARVIYRYFELSDEQNTMFEDYKPLYLTLSELAFDILEHRETMRKSDYEETESDTVWTVSIFKEGKPIDFFSIGNLSCNDNSRQLNQMSDIIERLVCIGRFSTMRQESGVCSDKKNDRNY